MLPLNKLFPRIFQEIKLYPYPKKHQYEKYSIKYKSAHFINKLTHNIYYGRFFVKMQQIVLTNKLEQTQITKCETHY